MDAARNNTVEPTDVTPRWRVRLSLREAMLLTALAAVAAGAWRFQARHSSPDRAWMTTQLRSLQHGDVASRRAAAAGLGQVPGDYVSESVPVLLGLMADSDPTVRREAAASLGIAAASSWPPSDPGAAPPAVDLAVAALGDALADGDPAVRLAAARALYGFAHGRSFRPANPDVAYLTSIWPRLVDALDDRDPAFLAMVVAVMCLADQPKLDAPPSLLRTARVSDWSVRLWVMEALPGRWRNRGQVRAALIALLKDDDQATRLTSAMILSNGPDRPAAALQALIEGVSDPGLPSSERLRLAPHLARYGPLALDALPALGSLVPELDDPMYLLEVVHWTAAIDPTLGSPETRMALDRMVDHLIDANSNERREQADFMLRRLGPMARPILPRLKAIADDDAVHPEMRALAFHWFRVVSGQIAPGPR